jgi:hypothetical protein
MNPADKRLCRHRYRQLIARGNRRGSRARGRGGNREEEIADEDDEELMGRYGGNEARKRRRRVLLRDVERNKNQGTKDRPIVLADGDENNGGETGSGVGSERRNGGNVREESEVGGGLSGG